MSTGQIKVLDCTFRDGGYYTNWDFSKDLVSAYLNSIALSGINFVEIGLRCTPQSKYLGAFAYCSDEFLESLDLPKEGVDFGVMINAGDYLSYGDGAVKGIQKYFQEAHKSPVSLVRIAAHFKEVPGCLEMVKNLKDLGYLVGFNLMQIGTKSTAEIEEAVKLIDSWSCVDVLYFADSLGNMDESSIKDVIQTMKKHWRGELGIHAHNNKGLALSNTLYSMDLGVSWLDATVLGMGRGAGNTKLEHLLIELESRKIGKLNSSSVFPLVISNFKPLQQKYEWGESLYYYLAANYEIHPSFVQSMVSCGHYEPQQIFNALMSLKSVPSTEYKQNMIKGAVLKESQSLEGNWSPSSLEAGQSFLILANGNGLGEHADAIRKFIKTEKPVVVSLNTNLYIESEYIDYYAVGTEARLLLEHQKYSTLNTPIIMPVDEMPASIIDKLKNVEIHNFGRFVEDGKFEIHEKGCKIPYALVAPYALAMALSAKAKRILLAGFDGFGVGDIRQREMEDVFELVAEKAKDVEVVSITPSFYQVKQSSVYSPEI